MTPRKAQPQTQEEIEAAAAKSSPPEFKPEPLPGLGGAQPIPKPSAFSLDKFKSKRPTAPTGVSTLLGALPHYPLAEAKDFVRLHPDETYWSAELCFVAVPIIGPKKGAVSIHLIDEDLAIKYLPAGKIIRHSLALASKPYDVLFLGHIPTTNLDNSWNESNLAGCKLARSRWVQLTSLKSTGAERYDVTFADLDAFPEPKWPEDTLEALIGAAFGSDHVIDREDHPGLLRLLGKKIPLK